MSQTKMWIAMSLIAGLFLLTGFQSIVFAQMSNDTLGGNATNATGMAGGNWTNATSDGNTTGTISGTTCPPRC